MAKSMKGPGISFPKGGNTKMFGKRHAGPQSAGTTATAPKGSGGKFPMGGKGHMFGKQHAGPRKAGITGK